MALLSTLVNAVAESEGLEEAYVSGVARYLREEGLITQAGRGRGAAHMSKTDAVHLLIGVNASPIAKSSPEIVRLFAGMPLVKNDAFHSEEDWEATLAGDDPVDRAFRKGEILSKTLCVLIDAYTPGSDGRCVGDRMADIFIEFRRPGFECTIEISDTSNSENPEQYAFAVFNKDRTLDANRLVPDRFETVTITQRTLRAIGQVLAN